MIECCLVSIGDRLRVTGFTCIPDNAIREVKSQTSYDDPEGFYIDCSRGKHFLAGQVDGGVFVGLDAVLSS